VSAAADDPPLRAEIHRRLAWSIRFRQGFAAGLEHAHAALELAEELGDRGLEVEALAVLVALGCVVGDPAAGAHARRVRKLAAASPDPELHKRAAEAVSDVLSISMELDAARSVLESAYRTFCERDEPWSADVLRRLASIELSAGRWDRAAAAASQALDISVQYGLEVPQHHVEIAWVEAHRGELEAARRRSEHALRLAGPQLGLHPPFHLALLGVVSHWSGDPAEAVEWFERATRQAAALDWREPVLRPWVGDHVEALLELGRIDAAAEVADVWEADALRFRREWVLARVVGCRGIVAAARHDLPEAGSLLQQAVSRQGAAGDPFGQARALLALGVVRRRQRQKRPAREALEAALAGFETLGAATFAARARRELGSIGGRTREEGLTGAERRVAVLVAEGRTNREVAAALFLGERTVASHLTHIYAKLGVRSRTELARKVQTF
jgi:DNA-binding CsgD family transcriptional regulator